MEYAGAAGLAGAFTACLVAAVLAFATRLIQHMPHNAQGAIVLSGVAGILQFGEAAFLWRVRLSCQKYSRCDINMRASCNLAGRLAAAGAVLGRVAVQSWCGVSSLGPRCHVRPLLLLDPSES